MTSSGIQRITRMWSTVLFVSTILFMSLNLFCFSHLRFGTGRRRDDDHTQLEVPFFITGCNDTCDIVQDLLGSHDNLLLMGFALPLCLISVLAYFTHPTHTTRTGDPNVTAWTLGVVGIPALLATVLPQALPLAQLNPGLPMWELRLEYLGTQAGAGACITLAFFLIPVTKHSPVLHFAHISFSQALAMHRVAGWMSFVFTMIHGVLSSVDFGAVGRGEYAGLWDDFWELMIPPSSCWTVGVLGYEGLHDDVDHYIDCHRYWRNFTGLISGVAFIILAITSIPFVRNRMYRLFYVVHIPMAWIMLLFGIAHYSFIVLYLLPGIACYLISAVPVWTQQCLHGGNIVAITSIGHSGCYALRLRRSSSSRAAMRYGGVCKLRVPHISTIWHPFSILHDANDEIVLLIRATGQFTTALRDRLLASPQDEEDFQDEEATTTSAAPVVLVDGIYPAEYRWHSTALHHHDSILLIAGGVGIVPFLDFLRSLHDELTTSNDDTANKQVTLHWYCREEDLVRYVCQEYLGWFTCESKFEIIAHITSRRPHEHNSWAAPPNDNITRTFEESGHGWKQPLLKIGSTRNAFIYAAIAIAAFGLHWWIYRAFIADNHEVVLARTYIVGMLLLLVALPMAGMLVAAKREHPFECVGNVPQIDQVPQIVQLRNGRPPIDDVLQCLADAQSPGAYFCGPAVLCNTIKSTIRQRKIPCSIYDEQSDSFGGTAMCSGRR